MNNMTQPIDYVFSVDFDNDTDGNLTEDAFLDYTCKNENESVLLYHTVLWTVVYSMVFLLGLSGNGLMLMVLLKRRAHLRMTDIYLLHLALADLLLIFTLPFALTEVLAGWLFGDFLCKLIGLLNRLNLLCGSLLLAGIGFDRYLAIVHVVSSLHTRRPRTVHLICAVLWIVCFALTLPNTVFLSVKENNPSLQKCHFNSHGMHGYKWLIVNRMLTHLLCFLLPLVVMGYCYTAVVFTLYRCQQSLEKQGAIRVAMVVTLAFCLCWLPYNITLFVDTLVKLDILSQKSCQSRSALALSLTVTEGIGFIHCCLNPILYAFVGVRFRNELLRQLPKCFRVCGQIICGRCFSKVSVSDLATTTSTSQYL